MVTKTREQFRVKRVDNWIEVYIPRFDRRTRFSYAMGFVDDGVLVITDVFLSPSHRKRGMGKRMVRKLVKESGASEVRVNNIQEGAEGFWQNLGYQEITDLGKIRRVEGKRSHYLRGEGYN